MSGIFISYRDNDARSWALQLRKELAAIYGEKQVFLDKDMLASGDWREQLEIALDRCAAVIVVIGPQWLNSEDESGAPRLFAEQDVHREEIETALNRKSVTVMPVLVDDAQIPTKEQLPESIQALANQQVFRISTRDTKHLALDLNRIITEIESVTGLKAKRPPRHPVHDKMLDAIKGLLIVFFVSLVLFTVLELVMAKPLDPQVQSLIVAVVFGGTLFFYWRR